MCSKMIAGQSLLEHALEDMCESAFTRLIDCGIISQEEYHKFKDEYERNKSNQCGRQRTYNRGN